MPALFVAHGAPMLLQDTAWTSALAAWGAALPRPRSILVVSAHWLSTPVAIGATSPLPLIYDFTGFEPIYYTMKYPCPGAPELGTRARALLDAGEISHVDDSARGLDHGVYVPLMCMFPKADIPVLQLSVGGEDPDHLLAIGRALAPLRDEGVLIVGSGFITHNLRAISTTTPAWARSFDEWTKTTLGRHDFEALRDYRRRAPDVEVALPTHEHFLPLLVAAGAAMQDTPRFPISGFAYGSFSKRSVQWG